MSFWCNACGQDPCTEKCAEPCEHGVASREFCDDCEMERMELNRMERRPGLKKSEAIAEFKYILNNWVMFNKEETTDVCAKILIQKAIDLGMLPPPRDAEQSSSYGYARVFDWEPEDE